MLSPVMLVSSRVTSVVFQTMARKKYLFERLKTIFNNIQFIHSTLNLHNFILLGFPWSDVTWRPRQSEALGKDVHPHLNPSLYLWGKRHFPWKLQSRADHYWVTHFCNFLTFSIGNNVKNNSFLCSVQTCLRCSSWSFMRFVFRGQCRATKCEHSAKFLNLWQIGLVGTAQGPGLHVLGYQALLSKDMQWQSLSGWTKVGVCGHGFLCKRRAQNTTVNMHSWTS